MPWADNLVNLYTDEGGISPRQYIKDLESKVRANDKITVHLNTKVEDVAGFVGNFKVKVTGDKELETGAIVVATGAKAYVPNEYNYGKDKKRGHPERAGEGPRRRQLRRQERGHGPVRWFQEQRGALLQPRVLLQGRQERHRDQEEGPQGPGLHPAQGHQDLRLPGDPVQGGRRARRQVHPIPGEQDARDDLGRQDRGRAIPSSAPRSSCPPTASF